MTLTIYFLIAVCIAWFAFMLGYTCGYEDRGEEMNKKKLDTTKGDDVDS